jgi:DNA-binding NarL/FixJ family response regulator
MITMRILLADDHSLVPAGFRSLLEKMSGLEIVGEVSNGHEALELIRKELPNLVLMDIAMRELVASGRCPGSRKTFRA